MRVDEPLGWLQRATLCVGLNMSKAGSWWGKFRQATTDGFCIGPVQANREKILRNLGVNV